MTIEEDIIQLWKKIAADPRFEPHIKQSIKDECVGCCAATDLQHELYNSNQKIVLKDKALAVAREIIEDLNTQLTEKRAINNEITRLRVNEIETREALEDELSKRKKDSVALLKVVEVVRAWYTPPISWTSQPKFMAQIISVVEDYLDVPEPPTEEENCIVVKIAYLEMP